jgi:hypothetical protein
MSTLIDVPWKYSALWSPSWEFFPDDNVTQPHGKQFVHKHGELVLPHKVLPGLVQRISNALMKTTLWHSRFLVNDNSF